jgi:hypothetical protein
MRRRVRARVPHNDDRDDRALLRDLAYALASGCPRRAAGDGFALPSARVRVTLDRSELVYETW